MSRLGSLHQLRGRTTGGGRGGVDVDPVMAAILGLVVVGGGGLAVWGASQDTAPGPAPVPVVQQDDPVVARALRIVQRVDGTPVAADGATTAQATRERRRAERASAAGRSADPFGKVTAGAEAVTGATAKAAPGGAASTSSSASAAPSTGATAATASSTSPATARRARELAERAARQASRAGAAADGSARATSATGASAARPAAVSRAARLRAVADEPARLSLRVKTTSGRSTRSRKAVGLLLPNGTRTVARVVRVSKSNRVVTLRLRTGASLAGKQSAGTRCVQRLSSGDCRLVHVRTGRVAVIRAPETSSGAPGAVTALRVTAIWRGGLKVAD